MELDEEDSHLCIRCNQTIIGLQNYVNHRQSNCLTTREVVKGSTNFDFLHGGKKMENYAEFNFADERDEVEIVMSDRNDKPTESEYKQYDYDFFSSLELQCMSKRDLPPNDKNFIPHRILTRKATAAMMAQNGDEWIDEGAVSKNDDSVYKYYDPNESETEDYSEESEPEVPRNYTRGKWKPGLRPPNNFTGGKWKPGVESSLKISNWDDNESSNDGNLEKSSEIEDSSPPPNHTKGKWIPGTKITKLDYAFEKKEKNNFWCCYCSRNLATRAIYERHLKSNLHRKRTKQENDLEETFPHTNLQEFSTTFDRAATTSTPINENRESINSSESKYATESDAGVEKSDEKTKKFRSRSKVTCEECDIKLPVHLLGKHLISHFHYRKMLQNPKKSFDIVLNNFHKIIIQSPFQCHPCKFYFNTEEDFMSHWNSIEHSELVGRVRGGVFLCSLCKFECVSNDDMTDHLNGPEHQQVVALINRSKPITIRLLTMLNCRKCHQGFRYNVQLMKHLKTCEVNMDEEFIFSEHSSCDVCQKVFQSALSLQKHKLKSHKIAIFFCSECQETFKTANEAKVHRRTAAHKSLAKRKRILADPQFKATLRKICPICKQEKLDNLELRNHILEAHPERKFSCGLCGVKFPLAQDVSRHVRNKVCKFFKTGRNVQSSTTSTITSNDSRSTETTSLKTSNSNDCDINTADDKVSENTSQLFGQGLDLIENNFSDILSPSSFQMSPGIEGNDFEMMIGGMGREEQVVEISFTCKLCDFCTDSHAEFLFHEILHQLPANYNMKEKIACHFCKKLFGRQSLRQHLRQHTNERLFECPVQDCPMSFTRKANMKNHCSNVHKNDFDKETPLNVCRICGKKFQSKFILEQHKFVHRDRIVTKQCQLPECIYIGRNSTDLKNHLLVHNDEKLFFCAQPNCDYRGQTMEQLRSHSRKHQESEFKFSCDQCEYKTKLSSHLKRHMRVHEMEKGKIYKCNYCEYRSNNSENLRKHVLGTNKHPGRFMYECDHCSDQTGIFKSNSMKEYRSHLKLAHHLTS